MCAKSSGNGKMKIPINDDSNQMNMENYIINHINGKFTELSGKIDQGFNAMKTGFDKMDGTMKTGFDKMDVTIKKGFAEMGGAMEKGFADMGGVMKKGFENLENLLSFIAKRLGYDENIQKADSKEEKPKSSSNKSEENNSLVNYDIENSYKNNSISLSEKNEIQDNNNDKIINLFNVEKKFEDKKEEVPSFEEKNSKKPSENPKSSVKDKKGKKMEDIIESKEIIKQKQIEIKKQQLQQEKKNRFFNISKKPKNMTLHTEINISKNTFYNKGDKSKK